MERTPDEKMGMYGGTVVVLDDMGRTNDALRHDE